MCAKQSKSKSQKSANVSKGPQRKAYSSSESDDENQAPNHSLRSTPGNSKRPHQQYSASDVPLDFLGPRPGNRKGPTKKGKASGVPKDFLGRGSSSSSEISSFSDTSNSSHSQSNTNQNITTNKRLPTANNSTAKQGRNNRKQSRPKRRKSHAMAEILKYQTNTELLIRKLPFQRYVDVNFSIVCFFK